MSGPLGNRLAMPRRAREDYLSSRNISQRPVTSRRVPRCLGTFDRNSESEKSEVGTTGRPLISVPKGSPAEERDTSTHRSDRGKARPVGKA